MAGKVIIYGLIIIIDLIISFPVKSQSWVDELRSNANTLCCTNNDGRRLDNVDWDNLGKQDGANSGYRVFEDDRWYEVPEHAVVKGRNQDGIARVWWDREYHSGDVVKNVRCFIKGVEG